MQHSVAVIGGGIIGLSCAWYLHKEGYRVTVIDAGTITSGTSFGNMGYVSPSHFVPIANPALAAKALRWMLSPTSPFYLKPRLDRDLVSWVSQFLRHSRSSVTRRNVLPLHNILQLSRELFSDMAAELGDHFRMQEKGCFMLCKTSKAEREEIALAKTALSLGLEVSILGARNIQAMEPEVEMNVRGGVLYHADCHVHPGELMTTLHQHLKSAGVQFCLNTAVTSFGTVGKRLTSIETAEGSLIFDHFILANGVWMPGLLKTLNQRLLLQAGKGYSYTITAPSKNLRHPAILIERRVAMTPMGADLRIGGTMEISGINHSINNRRVRAICKAVKAYYPGLPEETQTPYDIRHGLRPLTPDGLPYIGFHPAFNNLVLAGGHAMLGLSLSGATGKLVEELVSRKKTSIPVDAFRIDRF